MNRARCWAVITTAALTTACGSASDNGNETSGGASSSGGTSSSQEALGGSTSEAAGKLVINEVEPANSSGVTDETGAFPDWVELYNLGDAELSLSGLYLSDDPTNPTKFALDSSLTIAAKGFLLLFADGDTDQGTLHLSFKLSASGEGAYLFDTDGKQLDGVEWTGATTDVSYARFPDGTGSFSWCAVPSPNALNGSACGS